MIVFGLISMSVFRTFLLSPRARRVQDHRRQFHLELGKSEFLQEYLRPLADKLAVLQAVAPGVGPGVGYRGGILLDADDLFEQPETYIAMLPVPQ